MKTINTLLILTSALWILTSCSKAEYKAPDRGSISEPSEDPANPGRLIEEHQLGNYSDKVDIIVVSDNSGSMHKYVSEIKEKFQSFGSDINVNWRAGFTTGDMSSRKFELDGEFDKVRRTDGEEEEEKEEESDDTYYLSSDESDADEIFANNAARDETCNKKIFTFGCPSSNQRPFKASIQAMKKSKNKVIFRESADVVLIYINDQIFNESGHTWDGQLFNAFQAELNAENKRKQIIVHGVIVPSDDEYCVRRNSRHLNHRQEDQLRFAGKRTIEKVIQKTGGRVSSLCSVDISEITQGISHMVGKTSRILHITLKPIKGTLKLIAEPFQEFKWEMVGDKTIILDRHLKEGTKIKFSYKTKDSIAKNDDDNDDDSDKNNDGGENGRK